MTTDRWWGCGTTSTRWCSRSSARRGWKSGRTLHAAPVPELFNLRSDPFEIVDQESIGYDKWRVEHVYVLVPAQDYVGRFLQTFVALGTIIIFIRLALQEHDAATIFGSFIGYYAILGLFSGYFAFVYFNFFEIDLARETERR